MLGRPMSGRTIAAFGSGEFQQWSQEVDAYTISRATAGDGSVVIIPTASAPEGNDVFQKWSEMGLAHYGQMGVVARVSGLKFRADAFSDDHIAQLEGASMFYFSGGNPSYLADTLRDSPFWEAILAAVADGSSIAGCSAGACIMGDVAPDSSADEAFAGGIWPSHWYTSGLSILPGVMFGPHWDAMDGWIPGITDFIRREVPEGTTLIAIDEDTAMVGDTDLFRVFGKGRVEIAPKGGTSSHYADGETFTL